MLTVVGMNGFIGVNCCWYEWLHWCQLLLASLVSLVLASLVSAVVAMSWLYWNFFGSENSICKPFHMQMFSYRSRYANVFTSHSLRSCLRPSRPSLSVVLRRLVDLVGEKNFLSIVLRCGLTFF